MFMRRELHDIASPSPQIPFASCEQSHRLDRAAELDQRELAHGLAMVASSFTIDRNEVE